MSSNPFAYVNSINDKIEMPIGKDYNKFLTARSLSYHLDAALMANELNLYPDIPPEAHYRFLFEVLPKRKRFGKWAKPNNHAEAVALAKYLQISMSQAYEYLYLYTAEELNELKQITSED